MAENHTIAAIELGVSVLELLRDTDRVTASEASRRLGVSRSAAHRALVTLAAHDYALLCSRPRGYRAGGELLRSTAPRALDAREQGTYRDVLTRVHRATGESVHIAVLTGAHLLVVDGRRSGQPLDIGLRLGMVAPAHSMAGGKVLLAALADEQVEALYPDEVLHGGGVNPLRTRHSLLEEVARVRELGYAVAVEESERGVNSVGVVIDGTCWSDRVALVLSVPVERGKWSDLRRFIDVMTSSVAKV